MNEIIDIDLWGMLAVYALLGVPLAILLWRRVPLVRQSLVSVARMSLQLLFVGLYLQVVFAWNNAWVNAAWLVVMIAVADVSVARGSGVRLRRFILPLFAALLVGTAIPLAVFLGPILRRPGLMDAQYVIPLAGMILGNCLRADIIGLRQFHEQIRTRQKAYLASLADGATLAEAVRPYMRSALHAALAPTIASMATIGLVALPGMMTGVILGGAEPMTAIKYQIAIMVAIFAGTALTVLLAIQLTLPSSFVPQGLQDPDAFGQK